MVGINNLLSNTLPEVYVNNRHFYLLTRFPFELNVKYRHIECKNHPGYKDKALAAHITFHLASEARIVVT